MRWRQLRGVGAAAAILLAVGGCMPESQPQILTFNYAVINVRDAQTVIDSVRTGMTPIGDLLRGTPCTVLADFNAGTSPPVLTASGTPGSGQPFFVAISAGQLFNQHVTPASCPQLGDFALYIGDQSPLVIGEHTGHDRGALGLGGQPAVGANALFDAVITGFDAASRRTAGSFSFIDQLPAGPNTLLVVDGSFAMTPR